ncbi:3'-5' exonuclease [Paenarthrobacter nicotinovorans]|uniref:3'-5' exonuclease n=1 Tax=Paenarthrobacter nicotinovorans TaxID=29320 RepID=UPI0016429390|nr:3'-5' exonuclease [Paenarthrobacter nicotinovorans]
MPQLQGTRLAFIDVESTGLDATDELVELAIISEDERILFDSLVRPAGSHASHAEHIHGITASQLASAPPFPEVEAEISTLLDGAVPVAHNVDYDLELILRAYTLHSAETAPAPAGLECTMGMAMAAAGSSRRLRLHEALERFGIQKPSTGSFHRAAYDAECARRLWLALSLRDPAKD